ncbi:hypothetical protein [Deinococcus soli (ex Cha et al. 2016)]|uniref:Uncharacterized protein n=2 Tax=Deinococcus soli (ex Cha et al. 2016) TaxID=1309411 RepID=A0ACC6KQ38_9DEIO|nr:hypothetical protein [Deinococcus soli (ex Cha et al. 2016)]MDR6221440.1 hypothetical protein [Deinococcus soli (ex Cha et al. 2016)]MDR6331431.1 hypothetical protein [Deinococcus soli (ex Cha et al. 2016)]MDR6754590.1 hypothetical protein [Deinococcus soli (ex Cha et al. 2016)]
MTTSTVPWFEHLSYTKSEVVFIPNFWSHAATVRSHLDDAFREVVRQQRFPKMRLFTGSGLRNDLTVQLLKQPLFAGETFPEWIERVIGTPDFCVALNNTSSYSEPLAALLTETITQPASRHLGTLLGGYEAYLFAGRYDATPFGIHDDVDHSLLLHLGPAPQDVLIWPRAEYEKIAGPSGTAMIDFDIAAKAPWAQHLTFRENDLLMIPQGDFHVFMRPNYSVTLGLIPHPTTLAGFLSRVMTEFTRDLTSANEDASYVTWPALPGQIERLLDADGVLQLPVRDLVRQSSLRLESNGYLIPSPPMLGVAGAEEHTFQRRAPYPLLWESSCDQVTIYARGRTLKFRELPHMHRVLERISGGTPFSIADLIRVTGDTWGADLATHLVTALWAHRAIEVVHGV